MRFVLLFVSLLFSGCLCAQELAQAELSPTLSAGVSFIENRGQVVDQHGNFRSDVLFYGEAGSMTFHISKAGISYQMAHVSRWEKEVRDARIPGLTSDSVPVELNIQRTDLRWLGANSNPKITTSAALPGVKNFYFQHCPDGVLGVKSYQQVLFENLYAGIDVRWYEKDGQLEYDFLVEAGSDYRQIRWEVAGAENIRVNEEGELLIETAMGTIRESAPVAFQGRDFVSVAWKVDGNTVGFEVGAYDDQRMLVIDPIVRLWGTYFGGSFVDYALDGTVDDSLNFYMTGYLRSYTNLATVGSFQQVYSGGSQQDAFLVRFNDDGTINWATYYGGDARDEGVDLATDDQGFIYLCGLTESDSVIASSNTHQDQRSKSTDGFLAKFNSSSGARIWATYYGGEGQDQGHSCLVDSLHRVYLLGLTASDTGMATIGTHQPIRGGSLDGFVVQFDSNGVRQWATYYGGVENDGIATAQFGPSQDLYIAGYSQSTTAVSTSGTQQTVHAGNRDAFLLRMTQDGVRIWASYYGGPGNDEALDCSVDAAENIYLVGHTTSDTLIATAGTHSQAFLGSVNNFDGFVVRFDSTGTRQWGSYYGGPSTDWLTGCEVDNTGQVFVVGLSCSTTGIATPNGYQNTYPGGFNAATMAAFTDGGSLLWGSYYGGAENDLGQDLVLNGASNAYLVGCSQSGTNIATPGTAQPGNGSSTMWMHGFVAKFFLCSPISDTINPVVCGSYSSPLGNVLDSSGTYIDTLQNVDGCDSLVVIHLIVHPEYQTPVTASACELYVSPSGNNSWSTSGTYTDLLSTQDGCDSLLIIDLTIYSTSTANLTVASCDSFASPSGNYTWTSSGQYVNTLINQHGCDSVITIDLTIHPSVTDTLTISTCDSTYTSPAGNVYSTSGQYMETLTTQHGCDSMLVLDLTFVVIEPQVLQQGALLVGPNGADQYQWLDCGAQFAPISGATYQIFSPEAAGSYALEVQQGSCVDTSACFTVVFTGLADQLGQFGLHIYPNPTSGLLHLDFVQPVVDVQLTVSDLSGRLLTQEKMSGKSAVVEIEGAPGVYLLQIKQVGQEPIYTKVIKQP